jgi:hypothetical protein
MYVCMYVCMYRYRNPLFTAFAHQYEKEAEKRKKDEEEEEAARREGGQRDVEGKRDAAAAAGKGQVRGEGGWRL